MLIGTALVLLVLPAGVQAHHSSAIDTHLGRTSRSVQADACTVEGRPPGDFIDAMGTPGIALSTVLGTPVATPAPPVGTTPADAEIIAAVTATMEEFAACINAGDLPRMMALLTDDYFYGFFGGVSATDFHRLATPTPLSPDLRITSVTVEDVTMLDDGRVSAVTQVNDARAITIFALVDGRYLIDFAYELAGTATPSP